MSDFLVGAGVLAVVVNLLVSLIKAVHDKGVRNWIANLPPRSAAALLSMVTVIITGLFTGSVDSNILENNLEVIFASVGQAGLAWLGAHFLHRANSV